MEAGDQILGYVIATDTIPAGSVVDVVVTREGTIRARLHQPLRGSDIDAITWPCMICNEWRPDAAISVAHRKLAPNKSAVRLAPPDGALTFNVRYCNDRPDCIAVATADGPWPPEKDADAAAQRPAATAQCDLGAGVHVDPHRNCLFH